MMDDISSEQAVRSAFAQKWGLPNWRDPSAYPTDTQTARAVLGEVEVDAWRWEFLRRRADVREAWESCNDKRKVSRKSRDPGCGGVWEFEIAWFQNCEPKFGLPSLPDPSVGLLPGNILWFRHASYDADFGVPVDELVEDNFEGLKQLAAIVGDKVWLWAFDLREPLKPQIEEAERRLTDTLDDYVKDEGFQRPRERRITMSKWPQYLRVLDARDDGATFNEIGKVVLCVSSDDEYDHEGAKRAHESLKAAEKLQYDFPTDIRNKPDI